MQSITLRAAVLLALLLFAACTRDPAEPSPAESSAPTPQAPPASTQAEPKPFFVGRWASEVANCGEAAWVIREDGLETPGHVVCRFERVTRTPRGFEAQSTCTAEGPPAQWTLQFSYAESARALLIEEAPFDDVGLIRCEDEAPTAARDHQTVADPKSPQAAKSALETYYRLIASKQYDQARRLWTQSGEGSGQTVEDFAKSFEQYESYAAEVGEPGLMEGAAGSIFITLPVEVEARKRSGETIRMAGEATLRRANDVPGSTPQQRSWRIYRIELEP
ncbi:MAG TPA: hypothetical protein VF193_18115 [Steroidobacter sp.]